MNNDPAFPTSESLRYSQYITGGMTLRDYFAAKAMQGLIGRSWEEVSADELFSIWSNSAYAIADAMLKARQQ